MGLTFNNGREAAAMTVDASLNVGIGAAPSGTYKFEVTGTAKVSGNVNLSTGSGNKVMTLGGSPSANDAASFGLIPSNSAINWAIRTNWNFAGALEFCSSTAGGGSTFNTPSFYLASTGAATFSSSVTVGAGMNVTGSTNSSGANYLELQTTSTYYAINAINRSSGNYNQPFYIDGQKLILNSGSGGNVGINANTPRSFLEILKTTGNTSLGVPSNASLTLSQGGVLNEYSQIGFGYTTSNSSPAVIGYITTSGTAYTKGALIFATRDVTTDSVPTERMRIGTDGYFTLKRGGGTVNFGVFQSGGGDNFCDVDANVFRTAALLPLADNAYNLGSTGSRWTAVWAVNGSIQTSDKREKKDIINSDLGLDFVNKLRPVSFKWKVGQNVITSETITDEEGNETTKQIVTPREGKRTHYGLIAQEVESLLDGKDFGGFISDEETGLKGLRYDQFIPLLIKSIQEQQAIITSLKDRLTKAGI